MPKGRAEWQGSHWCNQCVEWEEAWPGRDWLDWLLCSGFALSCPCFHLLHVRRPQEQLMQSRPDTFTSPNCHRWSVCHSGLLSGLSRTWMGQLWMEPTHMARHREILCPVWFGRWAQQCFSRWGSISLVRRWWRYGFYQICSRKLNQILM